MGAVTFLDLVDEGGGRPDLKRSFERGMAGVGVAVLSRGDAFV